LLVVTKNFEKQL